MGNDAGLDKEVSVVVVGGEPSKALVPVQRDGLTMGSEGSVTVSGIRRAARRMRGVWGNWDLSAIAEATIGREARRPER